MPDFASGAPLRFPAFFASRVSPAPQVMALATVLAFDAHVSQHTYIPLLRAHSYLLTRIICRFACRVMEPSSLLNFTDAIGATFVYTLLENPHS